MKTHRFIRLSLRLTRTHPAGGRTDHLDILLFIFVFIFLLAFLVVFVVVYPTLTFVVFIVPEREYPTPTPTVQILRATRAG